jgi:hypothetical protein
VVKVGVQLPQELVPVIKRVLGFQGFGGFGGFYNFRV